MPLRSARAKTPVSGKKNPGTASTKEKVDMNDEENILALKELSRETPAPSSKAIEMIRDRLARKNERRTSPVSAAKRKLAKTRRAVNDLHDGNGDATVPIKATDIRKDSNSPEIEDPAAKVQKRRYGVVHHWLSCVVAEKKDPDLVADFVLKSLGLAPQIIQTEKGDAVYKAIINLLVTSANTHSSKSQQIKQAILNLEKVHTEGELLLMKGLMAQFIKAATSKADIRNRASQNQHENCNLFEQLITSTQSQHISTGRMALCTHPWAGRANKLVRVLSFVIGSLLTYLFGVFGAVLTTEETMFQTFIFLICAPVWKTASALGLLTEKVGWK